MAHDDYKGLTPGRNDKLPSLGLRAIYQMRRWLDFGADYAWSKRDSNQDRGGLHEERHHAVRERDPLINFSVS